MGDQPTRARRPRRSADERRAIIGRYDACDDDHERARVLNEHDLEPLHIQRWRQAFAANGAAPSAEEEPVEVTVVLDGADESDVLDAVAFLNRTSIDQLVADAVTRLVAEHKRRRAVKELLELRAK